MALGISIGELMVLMHAVYSAIDHVAFSRDKVDELVPFLTETGCGRSSLIRTVRMLSPSRKCAAANCGLRLTIKKIKTFRHVIATALMDTLILCTKGLASMLV